MSFDRSSTESLNSPTKDNFVPYRWSRSNTVRKVNSIGSSTPIAFANKEENVVTMKRASADDIDVSNARRMFENMNVEHCFNRSEKLRRSWTENTYRQSLDSISEYKRKNSFTIPPSRECSSFESSSSDCTDYTLRTADLTLLTEHSEYLSWIESLSSDYFTNATQAETDSTITDGKAGEWNNFWLNYNNARNLYLQQQNSYSYNSVPTSEEFLEANINSSNIKKEPSIENPDDLFYMTRAEMLETIKCCQKIIEVLQEVMNKTTAVKVDDIKNDSSHNNGQQKKVSVSFSKKKKNIYYILFQILGSSSRFTTVFFNKYAKT